MQLGGQLILLQGKVCQDTLSPFPLLEGDRKEIFWLISSIQILSWQMLSDEINNIGWNLTDSETWKKSWFYCVMHFYCQFFTCITQVPSVAELVKSLFFTCFWLIFVYIVAVLSVGLFLSCPFLLTSLNKFILSLENALRSFACLTKGDVIAIKYNEKVS